MTEVFLRPGEYHFGSAGTRLHTVLGSCVSITAWHRGRGIGGMCHYLLPARSAHLVGAADARYADVAVDLFRRDMRRAGTTPAEYEVKMFGGSEQFPHLHRPPELDVAAQNIESGLALLERYGFVLTVRDLGGTGPRRLIFDITTGAVWLRALGQPGDDRALA